MPLCRIPVSRTLAAGVLNKYLAEGLMTQAESVSQSSKRGSLDLISPLEHPALNLAEPALRILCVAGAVPIS